MVTPSRPRDIDVINRLGLGRLLGGRRDARRGNKHNGEKYFIPIMFSAYVVSACNH